MSAAPTEQQWRELKLYREKLHLYPELIGALTALLATKPTTTTKQSTNG